MSTENAQIEDKPIIEVDLGDNGGNVAFPSLEEAKRWIDREIAVWDNINIAIHGTNGSAVRYILQRQLRLPRAIGESLQNAETMQGDELLAVLELIKDQFEQYADYCSVYSESSIGDDILMMIQANRSHLAIGALASNLGIPANDLPRRWVSKESELGVLLSGYALCHSENLVRRSDLPEHKHRMETQLEKLDALVGQAADDQDEMKRAAASTIEQCSQTLTKGQDEWRTFFDTTQSEWKTLRDTFEGQLRLESPVKYWRDRADITSKAAKWSLGAFSIIAFVIIGVLVVVGPGFLERISALNNVGPFITIAFVSIPALTALWGLKHVARLFVTNIERSADARLRETMATTFLALTKEGAATIDSKERLLVLEALFRPPAPAPSDDGHWSGLSAILSQRNS